MTNSCRHLVRLPGGQHVKECWHAGFFFCGQPIQFGKSKITRGLQLADIVASSLAFALNNSRDETPQEWVRILTEADAIHDDSMFPDPDDANLDNPKAALNSLVLAELIRRAEKKITLLDGMPDFLRDVIRNIGDIMAMLGSHDANLTRPSTTQGGFKGRPRI